MTGSDFVNADCDLLEIVGGNWSYTILRNLDFRKKVLEGVNFFGADLTGSSFYQCVLRDCDFREAAVHRVSFRSADLRGSNMEGLDFFNMDLQGAKVDLAQCVAIAQAHEAVFQPD